MQLPAKEDLEMFLLPLAGFWAIFDSLSKAIESVNRMRETILIGQMDGKRLTLEHRKAMFLDWCLTMTGVIGASVLFSGIVFWIQHHVKTHPHVSEISTLLVCVALFPLISAFFFVVCGVSDFKLIHKTLFRADRT